MILWHTTMAAIAQMQNALRNEVRDLKIKIVELETAEAENSKLRKELSTVKKAGEDQKAQLELDFLNRMADIARENSSRVKDLEGKLAEHTRVNRRLNNEIHTSETPEMVNARIQVIEKEHQREIAQIANQKQADLERLQYQLRVVQTKRDEMTRQMEETMVDLELKGKKVDSLELELAMAGGNEFSSTEVQRKLRLANEENRRLKKEMECIEQGMTSKPPPADKYSQGAVKRLEKENDALRNAVQQAGLAKKNQDISILQLERRNNDLKMSLQKLEKHVNGEIVNNIGPGDSNSVDLERQRNSVDMERERQKMEMALREAKAAWKKEKKKNEELNLELQTVRAAKTESNTDLALLEKRNESLLMTCEKLEKEVDEVRTESEQSVNENSLLSREITEVQSLLRLAERENGELAAKICSLETMTQERETTASTPQKRASTMIQQMEQNLKREKVINDGMTAKIRKQGSNRDMDSSMSEHGAAAMSLLREDNRKLNEDVNQLQQKLEKERKLSRGLRREISNANASSTDDAFQRSEGARMPLSSPSPGPAMLRQVKEDGTPSSRGSVRGIAAIFESGNIQSPPIQTIQKPRGSLSSKKAAVSSDEVKALKRDLQLERDQMKDLEEELTRQCEINCSLLKEINALSMEMETKRLHQASKFKAGSQDGVDEMAEKDLKSRMDTLVFELSSVTKVKEDLEAQDRVNKDKFALLQAKVNGKVKEFEKIHNNDQRAVQQLEQQVAHLEEELVQSLALVENLKNQLNAQEGSDQTTQEKGEMLKIKQILQEKESTIARITNEKEQLVLSMNDMTSYRRDEIEELQGEVMQMKSQASEKSREVESLKAKLEQRNYGLMKIKRGDDKDSEKLVKENNALLQKLAESSTERIAAEAKLKQFINDKGTSSKSVQILRERNAALKFEVEKLTKKLAKISGNTPKPMGPEPVEARRVAI